MVDAFAVVAVLLLLAGVVGSVVPLLPGPVLSLVGVYLYWWSTGFGAPGAGVVVALTLVGLLAVVADQFAGALSARVGGASWLTTGVAAVVGLLALLVTGPVGMLLGVALTVFLLEFYRTRDVARGLETSLYATVGLLASAAVQLLLTVTMLVTFLVAIQ